MVEEIVGTWPLQGSHNDYTVGDGLFSIGGCIFGFIAHKLHDPWLYFLILGNADLTIVGDSLKFWLVWVTLLDLLHQALWSDLLRRSLWYLSYFWMSDPAALEDTGILMDPLASISHGLGAWDDWWRVILAGVVDDVSLFVNLEESSWAESR